MMEPAGFVIETQPISEETKEIAVRELREVSENITAGLKELRDLLAADSSIYYETDDEFLLLFLRPCKYYAESAYKLMKGIAAYRAKYKDIYYDLLPEHEKENFVNKDVINILLNRDQKGRRILLAKTGKNWDPSKVSTDNLLRIIYLLHLVALLEPKTQVHGIVVIIDVSDLGMKQVKAFTPSFAMKLTTFLQEAFPLRLKEMHIINNPYIFNIAWQIVKPLLNKKLKTRVFIHKKDMTSLHKFIDQSVLPEDYGGLLPKIWYTGKNWYPTLEAHTDFVKKWNSCGKK